MRSIDQRDEVMILAIPIFLTIIILKFNNKSLHYQNEFISDSISNESMCTLY
jgi:hypothetical protein